VPELSFVEKTGLAIVVLILFLDVAAAC